MGRTPRRKKTKGRQLVAIKPMGALGRVIVPAEVRHMLGLAAGSSVRIYVEDGLVVLEAETHDMLCPTCGKPYSRARRPSDD